VESDQKDLIISKLKAEILDLKKVQEELFEMTQEVKSLENRYMALNEEKVRKVLQFQLNSADS